MKKRKSSRKHGSDLKTRQLFSLKQSILIFAGLVLLIYSQTLWFNFTWFDDDAILLRNQEYISDISNLAESVVRDAEFKQKTIELYRPLQNISFIVDAAIGEFKPGMFHFSNMMIHLGVVILLFFLLELMGFSRRLSFAGAVILAVHPVFAFTVAWLPARGDLLLAFWALATLYSFIIFVKNGYKWKLLALHIFSFAMAMFSKESGVVVLAVCAFWYIFIYEQPKWHRWQLIASAGYLIILVLFFCLRSMAVADITSGGFGLRSLIYNLPVIPEALFKLFIPYPIVALPFYDLLNTLGGLFFIAVLVLLAFRHRGEAEMFLLGTGWFIGFTLPSMLYRPDWSDYIYDYIIHRSYLPLVGVVLIILILIRKFEGKMMLKPWSYLVSGIVIIFVILSLSFTRNFKDPLKFWEYAVRTNPESAFAHLYLGGALFFMDNPSKAIESYDNAIALKHDLGEAWLNRGITFGSMGNHQEALESFTQYLLLYPEDTMAIKFRAGSLMELGEYEQALPDLKKLLESGDSSDKVMLQYGLSSLITGDHASAHNTMKVLISRSPSNPQYLRIAALSDMMVGEYDKAIEKYMVALTVEPPNQNSLSNLGYAYWEKGEYPLARSYFERALEMDDESLAVNLGLVLSYDALNQRKALADAKERALALNPDLVDFSTAMNEMQTKGYLFTSKQLNSLEKIFEAR